MIVEAARFGDEEQQDHFARGWLAGREPVQAAREILAAAEDMSPLRRIVAVGLVEVLIDDGLPAWREFVSARCVGPFARAVLAAWDDGPEPGAADGVWLGVEGAAAALEDKGPDEALSRVWESMPGADLDDTPRGGAGHRPPGRRCAGTSGGGVRRIRRAAQHRPGGPAQGVAGGLPAADLAAGAGAGHRDPG